MLTDADLGDFTRFGDSPLDDLGLKGIAPHPIDSAFLGGRSRMWVVDMALSGRYRADNDAYARSLGYPIQDLPLLPLSGLVVVEHPAEPLEVFERTLVFTNEPWASRWLDMTRSTVALQGTSIDNGKAQPRMTLIPIELGDEAVALVEPPAVGAPVAQVGTIMIEIRIGPAVVSLTVNGGPGLQAAQVEALAKLALSRVDSRCHGADRVRSAERS